MQSIEERPEEKKKTVRFTLKKETIKELGVEELATVTGGSTAACCLGCATDHSESICSC
jgi:hypothetical protein